MNFRKNQPSHTLTINNSADYHPFLLSVYIMVLIIGTICLCLTKLTTKPASPTTIAVLNLIFSHFIFLLTVPFRIYYYSVHDWSLGLTFCRVISSMIHVHMYMSFLFYVIIIITRLLDPKHFAILAVLLCGLWCWLLFHVWVSTVYGTKVDLIKSTNGTGHCFRFASNIDFTAKVFNYIVSTIIIVVTVVLTALQAKVFLGIMSKGPLDIEFRSARRSMCFALIMMVSFIPYHIFRLYYLQHLDLENLNEVFLSLTTLNCLDMLTFLGKRSRPCQICFFTVLI
uniref:G protein-coupled receptor 141 n=1 Tax=Sphaeramia orbicularis TaxID=375764 RepID=A0A673AP15_9TELE